MSLQGNLETNAIGGGFGSQGFGGGGFGVGGGGIGAFGLIGLLGLDSLGRRRGDDDGCGKEFAVLQAIQNNNNTTVQEGRALGAAICDAEKTNLQQFYAAAIQSSNNTQSIKDQATAFAIVNDKRFDDLSAAGVNQTAAILARINDAETQSLRDQLNHAHRRNDNNDISIAISNSNAQAQAQFQTQNHALDRKFDAIFSQLNRNTQDVINFGTMAASANQANQQTNVK